MDNISREDVFQGEVNVGLTRVRHIGDKANVEYRPRQKFSLILEQRMELANLLYWIGMRKV